MAANIDLGKVIDGTDLSQDIYLMPYDIVYVPKSNIARVNKFVDEYINRVVPRFPRVSSNSRIPTGIHWAVLPMSIPTPAPL
jgi:hypothetical protein